MYTFMIASSLKKENRRVIANDFIYSFDRILDKNNLSPGKWVFNLVDKYYSTNDSTLIIKLIEPFSPFLEYSPCNIALWFLMR